MSAIESWEIDPPSLTYMYGQCKTLVGNKCSTSTSTCSKVLHITQYQTITGLYIITHLYEMMKARQLYTKHFLQLSFIKHMC